jgi:hypothetical protein
LYTNQKVNDLVAKAETEQSDYRRTHPVNVFFSPEKTYVLGRIGKHDVIIHTSVYVFNGAVLATSSVLILCGLYLILRRQLKPQGV